MMKTLALAALTLGGANNATDIPMTKAPDPQVALTCFKTGENTSGMNKICFYDCLGSQTAITIGAVELCPLTINN